MRFFLPVAFVAIVRGVIDGQGFFEKDSNGISTQFYTSATGKKLQKDKSCRQVGMTVHCYISSNFDSSRCKMLPIGPTGFFIKIERLVKKTRTF